MLNCKQVTKLVSESFVRQLSIGERLSLWMHTAMCRTCRSFRRLQIQLYHAISGKQEEDRPNTQSQLSQSARDRLAALIEVQTKKD